MAAKLLIVDDNNELASLLSSVFEEAGYTVIQAHRGREALEKAKAEKPQAAVVDVLLPDIMGYEVAAGLRTMGIPFVLMSGVFKGGRHSLDAVSHHGAAEYFEKPFELGKLLSVLGKLAPLPSSPSHQSRPAPSDADSDAEVEDENDEGAALELTGRVSVRELPGRVSATLRGERISIPVSRPLPQRSSLRPTPPVQRPAAPAAPPVLKPQSAPREAASVIPQAPTPPPGARMGLLRDNLPQLISAFYLAQETGELVLSRGVVRKTVFFEKGAPVFAISNLASDRFGQFLVRIGKASQEEAQTATLMSERTRQSVADVLVQMGVLNDTERMYYVGQQIRAIIYSLFAWEEGAYQLTFRNRASQESLRLDLHPAGLIMRGVRKLYSATRLARLSPNHSRPIPSQQPSFLLSDVEFESWEAWLLSRVDGTRSVEELIALSEKPENDVRGLLVGLRSLHILDFPS